MVGTRKLARLLDHAAEVGAKAVLVGDPRQLPEIDAGGLLAGLAERLPGVQLTENRRQRDEWERQALRQLRDGDIDTAIGSYRGHGRIILGDNAEDTRARLIADWWGARLDGEDVIMLAGRRSDVDDLNRRARTRLEPTGCLHGPVLLIDGVPFQAGDEVMTLRNDRRLHVRNGERGTIEAVEPQRGAMSVELTTGTTVLLPAEYLTAGHVAHAYAMTVHKAQGLTCDRAFTLGSDTPVSRAGLRGDEPRSARQSPLRGRTEPPRPRQRPACAHHGTQRTRRPADRSGGEPATDAGRRPRRERLTAHLCDGRVDQ